jgi:hypothetical protein
MASKVNRREFLNSAPVTGALFAGARVDVSLQPQRPNVLFILAMISDMAISAAMAGRTIRHQYWMDSRGKA